MSEDSFYDRFMALVRQELIDTLTGDDAERIDQFVDVLIVALAGALSSFAADRETLNITLKDAVSDLRSLALENWNKTSAIGEFLQ